MKLVELLVQELPKRSGWPVGADYVVQDCDGSYDLKFGAGEPTVYFDERGVWRNSEKPTHWGVYTEESYIRDVTVGADDADTSIVLREEYEAALVKGNKTQLKLIDLLVQELPKHGGWPTSADYAGYKNSSKDITFTYGGKPGFNLLGDLSIFSNADAGSRWVVGASVPAQVPEDSTTAIVSRREYLAALEASKKPKWNGEGLPPIGAEIEVLSPTYGWKKATVTAVTDNWLIAQYEDGVEFAGTHRTFSNTLGWETDCSHFRKVKSQAERQREATVASLQESLKGSGYGLPDGAASIVVDAIAQGKVSGIKLAD